MKKYLASVSLVFIAFAVLGWVPPPPGGGGIGCLTNWTITTTQYWTFPGDKVTISASGRDFDWYSTATNQITVYVDATNLVFNGPYTAGENLQWMFSGTVQWDGSNYLATGSLTSGDTNLVSNSATDTEICTNVIAGTNTWTFIVTGDTNALTFDSTCLTAWRAPTNDTPAKCSH